MDINLLTLPEGDRTTLALPAPGEWPATVAANRALSRSAPLGSITVADLIASARARAVLDAASYTRSLGLSIPSPLSLGGAVVATGHQPYPFHPGVAVKAPLVARLAQKIGGIPLFITVDSDDFRHDHLPLPAIVDGRLIREEIPFLPKGGAPLYERGEREPWERTVDRVAAIRQGMASRPRFAAMVPPLDLYIERLRALAPPADPTPAARAILLRRGWESDIAGPLLELPVSLLSTHDTFLHFAAHLIGEIERFAPLYNGELARYRRERKLRYPVNPFPDLKGDDTRRETPFWLLTDAGREPLYVDRQGRLCAGAKGEAIGDLAALREGGLAIRPKAIPLSIYLRLFVSDFFIHGVGGAKYDTITDPVIARFYGVEPPTYGCVTATLHAPMEAPADPSVKRA
ncbi:MAG: hypothetical protein HQK87_05175, partial [Nitrospinae bacterium]|nr:hypothetical protein [Nitrospinota bacterium]